MVLYQGLMDDLSEALASAEGIKRKGLRLSFLMKFKQVCNHPDQLAGSGQFPGRRLRQDAAAAGTLRIDPRKARAGAGLHPVPRNGRPSG